MSYKKNKDAVEWIANTLKIKALARKHCSDFESVLNDAHICVEYENSSRGMVSHVCKHFNLQQTVPLALRKLVVFIRSPKHIKQHSADHNNAMAVAKALESKAYKVVVFDEKEFEEKGLRAIKNPGW